MDEEKRQLLLLQQLQAYEPFQIWKELVVKGTIETLEAELNNADQLGEVILRAKLKQIASLKFFFSDVFENINSTLEQEEK